MTSVREPIVEELIPCPDPWDVARKLAHLPYLLFLDSSDRHPERGRYSYVMADPYSALSDYEMWNAARERYHTRSRLWLPPFRGGCAGLFGYELGQRFERIPSPRVDEFQTPSQAAFWYDWVIAFDHLAGRGWIISTGENYNESFEPSDHARARIRQIKLWLAAKFIEMPDCNGSSIRLESQDILTQHPIGRLLGVSSNFSRSAYLTAVQRVIDYIHAGDCFQVNLSQRLTTPLTEHPLELYGRLREVSPSPYGCYFDLGEFQILSASPEQFLHVSNTGEVITRPIKGTRPRGKTLAEDAAQLRDLTTNPKDRAENVMIVDLLRNDIGKVCEYGSVKVPKVCEVETYNYVHHLVSEVRGQLRKDKTAFDLLKACFPGGSVTGAPKVRAMEIIAELEPTARGPYCGSIGFIGFDGAMDSNILIRTFTAGKGWLQFPVGGGIVADSIPEREYEETLHKAAGLLRALKK